MKCKCKGCEKRVVGCHAQCEDYKEFQKDLEERKQKIRNGKLKDSEFRKHKTNQVLRELRKKK